MQRLLKLGPTVQRLSLNLPAHPRGGLPPPPTWDRCSEYRIKVEAEVLITSVTLHKGSLTYPYLSTNSDPTYDQKNLKLTFTDGKLTAAEVIK